jgi:hypothetical protein
MSRLAIPFRLPILPEGDSLFLGKQSQPGKGKNMYVVSPVIQLVPNNDGGKTVEMWIGYHIYDGAKIVSDGSLFHVTIPALRQVGQSELGIMETIMDGADAVYHEMSRRIRKQIESNMRSNAQGAIASETQSQDV